MPYQTPFPYDGLTGVISCGLAAFLAETRAATGFANFKNVPPTEEEQMWLDRIVPRFDEGTIPPPPGMTSRRSIYPVITFDFISLFTAGGTWTLPMSTGDRVEEKAEHLLTGVTKRALEHGRLLASSLDLRAAGILPWDLVINTATGASARIRGFLTNNLALLSAPLFYTLEGGENFEIWRSFYYERRTLTGSISMQWGCASPSLGEANALGNKILEYFTAVANEDLLWNCLRGNVGIGHPDYNIRITDLGELTPSRERQREGEVLERRDLTLTLDAQAVVERKRDPIESAIITAIDELSSTEEIWTID